MSSRTDKVRSGSTPGGTPDGIVTAPSHAFDRDPNTGMFLVNLGELGFTADGVEGLRLNAAGQALFTDGTALVPSVSFASDLNTGLYKPTIDAIGLTVGGINAYRATESSGAISHVMPGKLVIGGVINVAANGALEVVGPQSGIVGGHAAGELQIRSSSTDAFSGAVITGHNSSGTGNKQVWYFGSVSSSNAHIALINRETSGDLQFWTQNTERLKITKDGDISLLGVTGSFKLHVMTTGQRDTIIKTSGMMIYNITTNKFNVVVANAWVEMSTV